MKPSRKLIATGAVVAALIALGTAFQQQSAQAPIFEVDPYWPRPLPNHWLLGSVVGVAVDAQDHVLVVNLTNSFNTRTEIGAATNPPTGDCCLPSPNVLEFDADGNLVKHWGGPGAGYSWPVDNHGIALDPQGNVWIAGSAGSDSHIVKFTRDGKFVGTVGKVTAPAQAPAGRAGGDTAYAGVAGRGGRGGRGGAPATPPLPANSRNTESFGGPADVSFNARANEAYVADGYRNRRVAVVDLGTGAVKRFFGAFGNQPDDGVTDAAKQFGTPVTCAELARDGLLYVCDRANNRIQVFRANGTFVKEKIIAPNTRAAGSVWDVAFSADPQQRFLYVADGTNMKVHILDRQSLDVLTSFGDGGRQPGQFFAVHSIAVDSKGNIYTTESLQGKRLQKFVYKGVGPVTAANRGVVWPRR